MSNLLARADVNPRPLARLDTSVGLLSRQDNSASSPARADVSPNLEANVIVSITSNLVFFRGEDITLTFRMTPPLDVTGWNITFKIATSLGGSVQVTKSVGSGITVLDGPGGKFSVAIANADTASLTVGRYVWDCRRTDSGNRATLADGYIDLKQEVTA